MRGARPMPARIVQLDDLVPDELVFNYRGTDYRLPGDIDTETTFRLQELLVEMGEAETGTVVALGAQVDAEGAPAVKKARARHAAAVARQKKVTIETEREILGLFKVNHP